MVVRAFPVAPGVLLVVRQGAGGNARIIDLTEAAAKQLGIIDAGHAAVTIEILESP